MNLLKHDTGFVTWFLDRYHDEYHDFARRVREDGSCHALTNGWFQIFQVKRSEEQLEELSEEIKKYDWQIEVVSSEEALIRSVKRLSKSCFIRIYPMGKMFKIESKIKLEN